MDPLYLQAGAVLLAAACYVAWVVYRVQQRWFHRKKTPFKGKYAPPYRKISTDRKRRIK